MSIKTFSGNFNLIEKLGDHEDFQFDFSAPSHVLVSPKSKLIFVLDAPNYIYVFDSITRDYKKRFTFLGGEPRSAAVDDNDDSIVLAVYHNGADYLIKVSIANGSLVWSAKVDSKPYSIIVNPTDSNIYFLPDVYSYPAILIYSGKDGSSIGKTGVNMDGEGLVERASCLSWDLDGNLVVANNYSRELVTMTKKGKILSKKKYMGESISYITSINFESSEKMYVGVTNSGSSQVETWTVNGGTSLYDGSNLDKKRFELSHIHVCLNGLTGELLVCSLWNRAVYVFN